MPKKIAIGTQDFAKLRENDCFYIDKTHFIKEWWEEMDDVTLITRPRRFGKTLNMDMMYKFLSIDYAGRDDLFKGLSIWQEEKYRNMQGTYPVIFLSFSTVKETSVESAKEQIFRIIWSLFKKYNFLLKENFMSDSEKYEFNQISPNMKDTVASASLHFLSDLLCRYYRKKVIILLDEYDTPLQEAWLNGYWDEMSAFIRSLFNSTFKTNPHMYRSILTGITRVGKESMFSDLNNPEIVSTTSDKYADCFGFTEKEVFNALDEFGMSDKKQKVKKWYDGFTFGEIKDIYNPWSITHYLNKKKFAPYWANTSSNELVSRLLRESNKDIKMTFEVLMKDGTFTTTLDEQIVFNQLAQDKRALWSLLVAGGYLKVEKVIYPEENEDGEDDEYTDADEEEYVLSLTNYEVKRMFRVMIKSWFRHPDSNYSEFIKAFLSGDLELMNLYMNELALVMFSSFDSGNKVSEKKKPENFYHGFVLGLMTELRKEYFVNSNHESGYGRYDVMLEPLKPGLDGIIIEFKVIEPKDETNLEATADAALAQIEQKNYETNLIAKGILPERIRKYGFAFEGKRVLIKEGE